jgi:hypothetical protein
MCINEFFPSVIVAHHCTIATTSKPGDLFGIQAIDISLRGVAGILANGRVMAMNLEHGQSGACGPDKSNRVPQKRIRKVLTPSSRKARQDLLDDQVYFIITTRDNSKPDPFGRESSESGPLSWPAVAQAYNAVFRVGQPRIGSAAMEKRARQHREAFMGAHQGYPRDIVYKGTIPVVKAIPQSKSKKLQLQHAIYTATTESVHEEQDKGCRKTTVSDKSDRMTERSSRVAGWAPPDEVRNHDPYGMMERELPAREPTHDEITAIEVYDAYHDHIGDVNISTRDIVNSSALLARQRKEKAGIYVHLQTPLQAPLMMAVEWYAACISPTRVRVLPEKTNNSTNTTDMGIAHEFANLVDLYNVATVLEDSHVRSLVMARWQNILRMDIELELDASMLEGLFANTELEDPARMLWAEELHLAGLAEDIIQAGDYPDALVIMLEELVASGQYLLTCE